MEELADSHKAIQKKVKRVNEVLLVLDGTTGGFIAPSFDNNLVFHWSEELSLPPLHMYGMKSAKNMLHAQVQQSARLSVCSTSPRPSPLALFTSERSSKGKAQTLPTQLLQIIASALPLQATAVNWQ